MAVVYVDTNVYLDYFENRCDRLRPLGEFAFQFFRRALKCEFEIVMSDHVMDELESVVSIETIDMFLEPLKKKNKIKLVFVEQADVRRAKRLPTHWQDALHAVLAEKAGAELIVTRNANDFAGLFQAVFPEDV
ncbi:MAG: PIN domain-containing protein [Candidatus Diapherotrites archaeon]|nr:PIN domain-containing protein [Candidatus Diapherotrites archaeon]